MNSQDFKNYSKGAKHLIQGVSEAIAVVVITGVVFYVIKHGREIVETLGFVIAQAITIQI